VLSVARQRILIVEDEPDIVRVLEFSLKQAGFEPVVAYDGEQAQSRIQQQLPDLVVLDLMLPGLSGTEVCKQQTQTRTVDTHVKRLREKLGGARDLLETVRGAGYRLVEPTVK
jgi:two-component system alkaline phosphatase synthesis response regulator PhoP